MAIDRLIIYHPEIVFPSLLAKKTNTDQSIWRWLGESFRGETRPRTCACPEAWPWSGRLEREDLQPSRSRKPRGSGRCWSISTWRELCSCSPEKPVQLDKQFLTKFFGRGPLLRLSRVSTFPRLNKLGRFDFSRDSGKTKLWVLVVSLECRLLLET